MTLLDRLKALGVEAPKTAAYEEMVRNSRAGYHGVTDAALDELVGVVEEMHEKYAVVGRLSGDLAHHNTLLIGRCESLEDALARYRERNGKLVEQAGDWQLRAEAGADALSLMTARHDGEQKAKAKAEKEVERLKKETRSLLLDWQKRQDAYERRIAHIEASEKAYQDAGLEAVADRDAALARAEVAEAQYKEQVETTIAARQETHLAIIKQREAERLLATSRENDDTERRSREEAERLLAEIQEWGNNLCQNGATTDEIRRMVNRQPKPEGGQHE
jgi:hypothetical protein